MKATKAVKSNNKLSDVLTSDTKTTKSTKSTKSNDHTGVIDIIVNGQHLKTYSFDTPFSVLERFSAIIESSKLYSSGKYVLKTIPQFLRFSQPPEFKKGGIYEVEDIREIKNVSIEDLSEKVSQSTKNYPQLQAKEIIFVYLIEKGYTSVSIEDFGRAYNNADDVDGDLGDQLKRLVQVLHIEGRSFSNYRITYISLGKYVSFVDLQARKIQFRAKEEEGIFDTLSKVKPVEVGDFVIEGTVEEITLEFKEHTDLYKIFDALTASFTIPFILFSDGHTLFYKVYKYIRPIAEWLDIGHRADNKPVIYFYVLDEPETSSQPHDRDVYRGGVWLEDHIIRVDSRGAVTYVHDIINNMKEELPSLTIINETQYETRGKFSVNNQSFNKAVFASLVTNDPIFSHLLYLGEANKSILEKKRFVYYHDSQHLLRSSSSNSTITITMTDSVTETGSHIDVRISRAATENQILQFMTLFSHIFGLYLQRKNTLIEKYTSLYKSVNFKKYERKVAIKNVDIKTGKRLKLLEQHNPAAFKHGGYSSKCQPKRRQPYLVPPSEIENVKKKFRAAEPKDLAKELEKYGMMNWPEGSDDWYACYPREADDDEKRHIWPGLIKQKEKASNYDKYPLLPCCFIANQSTKKGSKKSGDEEKELEGAEDVFDRPLSSNKATPRGRYAELPYYIQLITESSGYTQVEYRKKTFLPILRYGIIEGMDSMVHCMERAINEDYGKMSIDGKKSRVRSVLDVLSKKADDWLVVCRQEMYNYTYDEVRKELKTPGTYIDPDMYINIFAKFYDCNIIVFKMDDKTPKGDVSTPRFSKAYLSYKFNPKTETVVIVKVQSKRARVGTTRGVYQCELIVKYNKGKVEYMFDSNDKFVMECFGILLKINDVFITSPEDRSITYDPQILL